MQAGQTNIFICIALTLCFKVGDLGKGNPDGQEFGLCNYQFFLVTVNSSVGKVVVCSRHPIFWDRLVHEGGAFVGTIMT